jgi:hypothetical protein
MNRKRKLFLISGSRKLYIPGTFAITVKTDNAGTSEDNQFTLTGGVGTNYPINWYKKSDPTTTGEITEANGAQTITFPEAGTYVVQVGSPFNRINFNNGGDRLKLLEINQWGDIEWSSFQNAFRGCANNSVLPMSDVMNADAVTNFSSAFRSNNLSDLPPNLLQRAITASNFGSAFRDNNIKDVPASLFATTVAVTDLAGTFQDNDIDSLPDGLLDACTETTTLFALLRGNGAIVVPERLFEKNIKAGNFSTTFIETSLGVDNLGGIYISLGNTIIIGQVTFTAGLGNQYNPNYANPLTGQGTAGANRALLVASASVSVLGAGDEDANGLYERTSSTVYTNENGYTFTRSTTTYTLRDDEANVLATGTCLGVSEEMPHSVQRLGNSWSGAESEIIVSLAGAGWSISDGGPSEEEEETIYPMSLL